MSVLDIAALMTYGAFLVFCLMVAWTKLTYEGEE